MGRPVAVDSQHVVPTGRELQAGRCTPRAHAHHDHSVPVDHAPTPLGPRVALPRAMGPKYAMRTWRAQTAIHRGSAPVVGGRR